MSQARNMADLKSLIGLKTGQDASPALDILSEVFIARRPAWNVLVCADMDFNTETYQLPYFEGCYIRFTIDAPDVEPPVANFFRLDPPLDIHTDHVRYSFIEVLSPADLL